MMTPDDQDLIRARQQSRARVMALLLGEGMLLAGIGGLCGIALGHLFTELTGMAMRAAQQGTITGWIWLPEEFIVLALAVGVGALAALLPAWRAYRTDIAGTLARG